MKCIDLALLTSVSRPTVHPDGTWAVVSTSRPDLEADAYVGQLWRIPLDGKERPRRITRGISDRAPRFSPDGKHIAFLRSPQDQPAQLCVMPVDHGEAIVATDAKLGVGSFEWSPDSKFLAYTARVAEHGRYGTVKNLGADAEPPRHISVRKYQSNGVGYTNDRRTQIFLIPVPDAASEPTYAVAPSATEPEPATPPSVPEPRQLTSGDFDHVAPRFSPQGDRLAFLAARHDARDIDLANNIYEVSLNTTDADPVALVSGITKYGIDGFAYGNDAVEYFIGAELGESGRDFVGRNGVLFHREPSTGAATGLTDPERCDLAEGAKDMMVLPSGSIYALNTWHGNVRLVEVSPQGEVSDLVSGTLVVTGFDVGSHSTVISYTGPLTKGDVAVVRESGTETLTDFSAPLVKSGIARIEELVVNARDGQAIQGWVLTPDSDGPHPVLLNIHGGPYTQYTGSFFDEAQVYVDAGYAVVMCNPRGASGYGEKFGRAIQHHMGTLDFTDVLDFLDGAITAHPNLDADRLGIMGGSYGGYLTAWTIGQDHRFTAAIVERGFIDPETFIGTSDIGDFFGDEYTGTDHDRVKAQSPQAFADQVTTPTLIVHSENDLRCPLSQGQRYYLALKRNGVDAELLIFPGEDHELSRSGRPRHRLQRFEAILDWWHKYLPVVDN